MTLTSLGFLHVGFVDILDIVVVAIIIFMVFRWIRGSSAMNIFLAIISPLILFTLLDLLFDLSSYHSGFYILFQGNLSFLFYSNY